MQLLWRTLVIGLLASLGTGILPLPATLLGAATGGKLLGIAYAAELLVIVLVAVPVLVGQWRRLRQNPATAGRHANPLMVRYAAGYLSVMAVLWLTALPAYFGAVGGVTANGDPIGSIWYVIGCFVIAGLCVAAAATVPPIPRDTAEPALASAETGSTGP